MKKIILAISLLLASNTFAQTVQKNLPVICSSKETVFEVLTGDEFKEKTVWVGRSIAEKNYSALLINEEKGTWTLVKFDEKTACMLDTGDQSKMLIKGEKIRKM